MSSSNADLITRLAAADPARGLLLDEAAREALWERLSQAGPAPVTDGTEHGWPRSPRAPVTQPRTRRRWRSLFIVLPALVVIAAGGVAAAVIQFGKPERSVPIFTNPHAELGALTPGTVRLLPVATPDPHGGPAWGMRVLSTSRGVGCIQVGRLLDGRLGALGQDGAFADDGRFHELPVSGLFDRFSCAALDGKGRIFNNVTVGEQPASGSWSSPGVYIPSPGRDAPIGSGSCYPAGAGRYERPAGTSICAQGDERNLYYGLLGPDARSITYKLAGKTHTLATSGADGAYLLVTTAPAKQLLDFANATTADVVPVDGPITEIHYRDGSTCHLTARSWVGGASACTPALKVPVGYAPVPVPARGAVRAPLHTRVVRNREGHNEVLVSFASRVAINSARGSYSLSWRDPHTSLAQSGTPSRTDVAAGQTVTLSLGRGGPDQPHGLIRGTVTLVYATGPTLLEGPGTVYLPVGSFAVRVP